MESEDLFCNFSEENTEQLDPFQPNTSVEETPSADNLENDNSSEPKQDENNSESQPPENVKEKSNDPKMVQLPITRVRNIMKLDPDITVVSSEAVFTITKATELFIESLARESYSFTAQSKKKTVLKRDVDLAIASIDSLMFLEGALNF